MRTKKSFPMSPGYFLGLRSFSAKIGKSGQILVPVVAAAAAASLGGCAPLGPQPFASVNAKELFPSSIYGPASRGVVADGEPVPRGGGVYMVGEPYTIAGQT